MRGEKGDTGLPGFDGMAGAPGQKVPYLSAILALVVLGFVFYVFVLVLVFVQLYCWIVTTRFVSMCETFLRTLDFCLVEIQLLLCCWLSLHCQYLS